MTETNTPGGQQPPKDTRFKPGTSGNPRGRPKKQSGAGAELARLLEQHITVKENGVPRRITHQRAIYRRMIIAALSGDVNTGVKIFNLLLKLAPKEEQKTEPAPISENDRAIVEDFLRRNAEGYLRRSQANQNGEKDATI
jgi:Family of unknown function (DUF5681)